MGTEKDENLTIGQTVFAFLIIFAMISLSAWILSTRSENNCEVIVRQGHDYNRCYEGFENISVTHSPECRKCKFEGN